MDIIFKKGIPGFDNINDFTIKSLKDNDKFKILEAKKLSSHKAIHPDKGATMIAMGV